MKKMYGFIGLLLLLILPACVPLPELDFAREALERGDLENAYQYYLEALKKAHDDEQALKGLEAVRAQLTSRAIRESASVLERSAEPSVPKLQLALSKLNGAKQYDPNNSLLDPTRTKYQNHITRIRNENKNKADQMRVALLSQQFPHANQLIMQIKDSDPQSDLWRTLESEYVSSYGDFLRRRFNALLSQERFTEARDVVREFRSLNFREHQVALLRKALDERELRWLKARLDDDLSHNRFYRAYKTIQEAGQKQALSSLMDGIRERGSKFYLDQARRRMKKGELSRAYLEVIKGYELDSRFPGMFETRRKLSDEVLKRVQKFIAIPTFGAPKKNPDLGPQFSDALISYLFQTLSYGIHIVEREKIDILLEEQRREFKEVGNILNVDLIITGNVSLMNIDHQKSENQITTRPVKVGERLVENPAYDQAIREEGSQSSYLPPRLIKVDETRTFTYKKGRAFVKGFAGVSARIFDTREGRITSADTFNAKFQAADDYQDAIDVAGVREDPLELPSDTEVMEKLRNEVISKIAAVVQKRFEKRERSFLEEAKHYLNRREEDKVIDALARGFMYCTEAKVKPDDRDFVTIRKMILERTEQDFLSLELVGKEPPRDVVQGEIVIPAPGEGTDQPK